MSLKLDLEALRSLADSLDVVANEFSQANTNSDSIADAVGHDGLAECVRDFAHKWDDAREGMTENLKVLAEAAKAVSGTFTDVDTEFATAVEASDK